MDHKKPRYFRTLKLPRQCRQAGLHRSPDAEAALESAKSADVQSANTPARCVLAGYSTLGTVPDCPLPFSRHEGSANSDRPAEEWSINCYT